MLISSATARSTSATWRRPKSTRSIPQDSCRSVRIRSRPSTARSRCPAEIVRAAAARRRRSTTRWSSAANGDMTITIPRGTAMVFAHVRAGHLTIRTTTASSSRTCASAGDLARQRQRHGLRRIAARPRRAPTNSSFDSAARAHRHRRHALSGLHVASDPGHSSYGSIVYDNGDFAPGLARFESEHGNVALGVRGNAQIGAHSGTGHVVSSFGDGTPVRGDPATRSRLRSAAAARS